MVAQLVWDFTIDLWFLQHKKSRLHFGTDQSDHAPKNFLNSKLPISPTRFILTMLFSDKETKRR